MNPIVPLTIAGYQLDAELALDPPARELGLMRRAELPSTSAMVLCYPHHQLMGVWMRETSIPLSAAFLDGNKNILNIVDLEPFDMFTRHYPLYLALYVLEVERGWFRARGVGAGIRARFELPPGMEIT